jgi:spermidine/putrescine transport system ATP-binding protein
VFGLNRDLSKPSFRVAMNQSLHVLLRPEDIRVLAPNDAEGVAGKIVERNYKGSTLDSVIELEDGSHVMASEFFDEDDPAFDYSIGERVRVSWVDGWEWLLAEEGDEPLTDEEELAADDAEH